MRQVFIYLYAYVNKSEKKSSCHETEAAPRGRAATQELILVLTLTLQSWASLFLPPCVSIALCEGGHSSLLTGMLQGLATTHKVDGRWKEQYEY